MSTRTEIYIANMPITIVAEDVSEEKIIAAAEEANALIKAEHDSAQFDEMKAVCIALFKLVGEYQDLKSRYDALDKTVDKLSGTKTKRTYTPARKNPVPEDNN